MSQHNDMRLSDDLLEGADAIAEFMYGDRAKRRKVYYLAALSENPLPTFRLGERLCGRRSTMTRWIAEQEGLNRN